MVDERALWVLVRIPTPIRPSCLHMKCKLSAGSWTKQTSNEQVGSFCDNVRVIAVSVNALKESTILNSSGTNIPVVCCICCKRSIPDMSRCNCVIELCGIKRMSLPSFIFSSTASRAPTRRLCWLCSRHYHTDDMDLKRLD